MGLLFAIFLAQVGLPFSMVAGGAAPTATPTPTASATGTPTPGSTVATPTISPSDGSPPVNVTITCSTAGATIFYTVSAGGTAPSHSGGTPTGSTHVYTGPFSTGSGTQKIVEALGYHAGLSDSVVNSATYQSGGGGQ